MDLNKKRIKNNIRFKLDKLLGKTYYAKRNKKIVFVLSTGRCGSTSIVKMFNQHPKFSAFHEDIPELIKLSTQLAERPDLKKEIYKHLDLIFRNKIWSDSSEQIHVHSDHRLWNLVEFLSEYFPNSVFIHLLRNPEDSLKSFVPRNWYPDDFDENDKKNIFEKYRLRGDKLGVFTNEEWKGFSNPEKCAWYWNFVNVGIAEQLDKLDPKKHKTLMVKLENMTHDMNTQVSKVFGLEKNFSFKNIVSNRTQEDKVIKKISPEFESAIQRFANEKDKFYSDESELISKVISEK